MKKKIYIIYIIIFSLANFISCGYGLKVVDFSLPDIENIEIYRFSGEVEAEKIILTDEKAISQVFNFFNEIKTKGEDKDIRVGGNYYFVFVFNQYDNTYTIYKTSDKSFELTDKKWYKTDDNISFYDLWDNLDGEIVIIPKYEIPRK